MKATPVALLLAMSLPMSMALAEPSAAAPEPTPAISQEPASSTTPSSGVNRYVSDDIFTYLHGGPGKQYRILGSVKAGDKVQFLALDASGKYAQIIDGKGRTAWILGKELQTAPSYRAQVTTLQEQLRQLQLKMDNIDSDQARELKEKRERLTLLEQQVSQQEQQLAEQGKELQALRQQKQKLQQDLGTKEQDQQYRWWREGGYIAGVGLLLGLLLPYLPRPRRRSKDRWMN
ncbi:MAG: TIGR04211 family SH3 domain-containing protein [Aeromonadaceae bacterium]|nr:TIGR04211 family SH3 domain-containing protein [Aeromonadaceae bacterium]